MSDFSNFLDVQTKTAWGRTLAEFASFCDPEPASLILDIGCGPGLLPVIFAREGHTAFGIDADFSLLSSTFAPNLIQADALDLPFQPSTFKPITATNVLFLLDDPLIALQEWARVLAPDGELCLLNPSENLSVSAATRLADERGLDGTARESLLNWAQNAEHNFRWTEDETRDLLSRAGLRLEESVLRVGPGFARFVRAKLC
ncbi:MAG: class I SAM-dependent methyltransferase [Anaerolineales bacterium]